MSIPVSESAVMENIRNLKKDWDDLSVEYKDLEVSSSHATKVTQSLKFVWVFTGSESELFGITGEPRGIATKM